MADTVGNFTATVGPIFFAICAFCIAWKMVQTVGKITGIKAFLISLGAASLVLFLIDDLSRFKGIGSPLYNIVCGILNVADGIINNILKGINKNG